jgi:hypothetical protein
MISRTSAMLIAEAYEGKFRQYHERSHSRDGYFSMNTTALYDFLFQHNYEAYFCNAARFTHQADSTRAFKEFLMKLHTGESLSAATPKWEWRQRQELGQQLLHKLAEDILVAWASRPVAEIVAEKKFGVTRKHEKECIAHLTRQLELDGYEFRNNRLLETEADVLDAQEEQGILHQLHKELGLGNEHTAFHHLQLTEEHYVAGRWDDSISNSRKFLESVLQEIAAAHSLRLEEKELEDAIYGQPVRVREYLQRSGLLEEKEKKTFDAVYGLLSSTGGHPYMAEAEQARLLRHLALTLAQFAMLRLKGRLNASSSAASSSPTQRA